MKIKSLLLITGNPGKAREFQELLHIESIDFSFRSLPLQEIQSMDIEAIGAFKTRQVLEFQEEIEGYDAVLTDDTGLSCKGLNGFPGPLIKWFLDALGAEGIYEQVRDKEKAVDATCLLTLAMVKTGEIKQFHGVVPGTLVPARGNDGFGWDPIFLPNGADLTYAETPLEEKNKISHRALAVRQLREWILQS